MGETSTATAREVELTRKRMGDKMSKLSERAPSEARKLGKKIAFAGLTALAVMVARRLAAKVWERTTGEPPPMRGGRKQGPEEHAPERHAPERGDHEHRDHERRGRRRRPPGRVPERVSD